MGNLKVVVEQETLFVEPTTIIAAKTLQSLSHQCG